MSIQCPYCGRIMTIRDAKPGRYQPACRGCNRKFAIVISADPNDPPTVSTIAAAMSQTAAGQSGVAGPGETAVYAPRNQATSPDAGSPGGTAETLPPRSSDSNPGRTARPSDSNPGRGTRPSDSNPGRTSRPSDSNPGRSTSGSSQTAVYTSPAARTRNTADETVALANRPAADPQQQTIGFGETRTDARPTSGSAIPETLGGYRIVKELGRGAMGAVYLARQVSLDRPVALKVIEERWCDDPVFIARFTREAFAAAQLSHHNVVQIYDLGVDRGTNFFSMEFVPGRTLADLVAQEGRLEAEVAVGYVLQAARGLKFAHDQGLVHRDVKPANLLLSDLGVVKVADLGLVKSVGEQLAGAGGKGAGEKRAALAGVASNVTEAQVAMGTPDYMPPEQIDDAASVDHRADIYSLGCTLYVMLTGRPPYQGTTAIEVMQKHKYEEMVRPEEISKHVSPELSEITMRMVAKDVEDRYSDLGEVIRSLEGYLGVQSSGPFPPSQQHADTLESCAAAFSASPTVKLRKKIMLGFFALVSLVAVMGTLLGSFEIAGAALGLGVATTLSYAAISGWRERSPLFDKVRELVVGGAWTDWLTALAALLLTIVILAALGLLLPALALLALAVGLAIGLVRGVDRKVTVERQGSLNQIEHLLRTMRKRGLDEGTLRQFVVKYGGDGWEELYESLFGYEALLSARQARRRTDQGRPKAFRAWRDPIIRHIEARLVSRREARQRKVLEKVEKKGFEAQGLTAEEAQQKAERTADVLVEQAAKLRRLSSTAAAREKAATPLAAAAMRNNKTRQMLEEAWAEGAEKRRQRRSLAGRGKALAALLNGERMRFLVGAVLVAGCALWVHQNKLIGADTKLEDIQKLATAKAATGKAGAPPPVVTKPLSLLMIPSSLTGWFDSFNSGIAGVILLVSSVIPGARIAMFVWPASAVAMFGAYLGIPGVGGFDPRWTSMTVGIGVAVLGLFFGRTKDA